MERIEDARKWLSFHEKGVKPTRYKTRAIIYSDSSIQKELNFTFENHKIKLNPFNSTGIDIDPRHKYMPSFVCEVISDANHQGGDLNVKSVLDEIFTWLEFDFEIGNPLETWEEYEGEWIKGFDASVSSSFQNQYQDMQKVNFESFLDKLSVARHSNSKRAKKVNAIRSYLQEGLKLKFISSNYSFLSFYKVVEIISDDLASKQYCSTENAVVKELVSFKLLSRGSQRTKIYYLLSSIENNLPLDDMVYLADVRNELAHNDHHVDFEKLVLCQKLAYWAAENFISIVASDQSITKTSS
ncbi:hypothetical protein ACQKP8_26435 [Photobacterium alginatilyticum]|uniref:hypothetical protein n=1 Tax=Photobacterium alginatilyticum TaxID=1775171 RepID=UPI0040684DD4